MAKELKCQRYLDVPGKSWQKRCLRPATLKWDVPLCADCSHFVWLSNRTAHFRLVREMVPRARGGIQWDPGITYCLLLNNGNLKIGFVHEASGLVQRWRSLARQYGLLTPIATEHGGELKECYRHALYHEYRVPTPGEQFRYEGRVAEYAMRTGHISEGIEALVEWNEKGLSFRSGAECGSKGSIA